MAGQGAPAEVRPIHLKEEPATREGVQAIRAGNALRLNAVLLAGTLDHLLDRVAGQADGIAVLAVMAGLVS